MTNVQVEKLAQLDYYTEGPVSDKDGNMFVTTLSGGQIVRIKPGGDSEVWASGICPNGQVVLPTGEHWVCESSIGQITSYPARRSPSTIVVKDTCAGIRFTTPNDLLVDSDANLFFTESIRDNGKVFFIGNDGREALLADGIDYANGLALNAAQDILYVAESYQNRILALHLSPDKTVTERRVFVTLPAHASNDATKNLPDGLALDHDGCLWIAHYGMQAIHRVSPEGKLLLSIDTQLPLTSNVALIKDEPFLKQILVTGGYGEPGPGAVLSITVIFTNTDL
jgi:gluconolactonase